MSEPNKQGNRRPAGLAEASTAIELVGSSTAVSRAQELVRRAASLDTAVLLVGEHGIDVEAVARELHARGRSSAAPWVVVECASGEAAAVDRALFGSPPASAPTDLDSITGDSRLAAARGGTLFLRDVADLPAAPQARLARIARDGEARIDGAPSAIDVRLIASAPPAIDADVREHRFRADLYRRLAVSRIDLPALRNRPDDIPAIAARLLEEACAAAGVPVRVFTHAALAVLSALPWPGNLADLRAVVARMIADTPDSAVEVEHVLPALHLERPVTTSSPAGNLREARLRFEREYIATVLQQHGWKMAEAAHTLGIQRPNLYRKARQLGIPVTRASE